MTRTDGAPMAFRRSFKSDTSFLEKISIGAIGTQRVFADLSSQGHKPIELERGSMDFKIWKEIKIKRIRVPDILCVRCSRRFESRAKTSLELSMSHSLADQERAWDHGLRNEDYVAFTVCEKSGTRPVDWRAQNLVQYVSVSEMRLAQKKGDVLLTTPKGVQEGFEKRIIWPIAYAKSQGVLTTVGASKVQYRRERDGRLITLGTAKKKVKLSPILKEGEKVSANQVLASVVDVSKTVPCPKDTPDSYYVRMMSSLSLSERYAAAKALSYFHSPQSSSALKRRIEDPKEHVYVRLEAAASLARNGEKPGWDYIHDTLRDEYLQNRLEAVILLGEIDSTTSVEMLGEVLADNSQHHELRAGAAWALGELHQKAALEMLVKSFNSIELDIRAEAARALAKLASKFTPEILAKLPRGTAEEKPGIAWAISRGGKVTVDSILQTIVDDETRKWAAYIVGTQGESRLTGDVEAIKKRDPELYFAVTVLWRILSSWVNGLEEY